MGPSWALPFGAALLLAVAGTPLLRKLALATEFVDHPGDHKSHRVPVPYLGGVALILAVLAGLAFSSDLNPQVAVIALAGPLIGILGLLDDHRTVSPRYRFLVEFGVGAAVLSFGLGISATDVPVIDGALTLIWIVGVTNAVNLLDNMDGLAAGVAAAAAMAILALAVLGEQFGTASLAAAMAGACAGFLVYNRPPASIYMGDAGSLFLGFTLAVATIEVDPALSPPASFAVPLVLLALPVLDTTTVTLSRLRHGRQVSLGGKDHLSHRLVARGLSPGIAVAVLVAVEAVVGGLAVLAGREIVPLWAAMLGCGLVLAGLSVSCAGAEVYPDDAVTGLPKRLKQAGLAAAAVALLLAAPSAVALLRAQGPGAAGAEAVTAAVRAMGDGDVAGATVQFRRASEQLRRAEQILGGRLTSIGRVIPGIRANVAASRALVAAGRTVAGAAAQMSAVAEISTVQLGRGSDPAREAERLAPALAASAAAIRSAEATMAGLGQPYLWPGLDDNVRRLRSQLATEGHRVGQAAELARMLPAMLGANGDRRYFVAIQDSAELRGSGGVPHLWGELAAERGRLRLVRFGSIDELNLAGADRTLTMAPEFLDRYRNFDVAGTWENVSVSPDFAVTGDVISRLYPQSGGAPVDGVIGVDLPGLAALVGVTGPVSVDGWPAPATSGSLVDLVLRRSHEAFPDDAGRRDAVSSLVRRVLESFTSADLGTPATLARSLTEAVSRGHLLMYASRPEEQKMVRGLGAAGRVADVAGDSLLLVNQNASAAEIDSYLTRHVRYDVTVDPGRRSADLTARLELTLRNDAPSTGPRAVVGPYDDRFVAGENRTAVSVYTPLGLGRAALDRSPTIVGRQREFGRHVYSTLMSIPSHQARTLELELGGRVALSNGWYHLDLPHQTTLGPDSTEVSVSLSKGWRIVAAPGMRIESASRATARLQVTSGERLSVRVERTPWARLWASGDD